MVQEILLLVRSHVLSVTSQWIYLFVVHMMRDAASDAINSMKAVALGPVYQASVDITNIAMKQPMLQKLHGMG